MPDEIEEASADKLRKLGKRLRQGMAQRHPLTDKQRTAAHTAIREQWHLERANKFVQSPPAKSGPTKGPKPPEPEQ